MEESKGAQFLDVESFPPEKLLQLAEENFVKVNYSDAEYYYSLCLQKQPENEEAASQYAECLKTQGKFDESIKILKSAVQRRATLDPSQQAIIPDDYRKYNQLAELLNGEDSVRLYEMGIQIIKDNISKGILDANSKDVKRDLSEAYSGLAEIYQTDFLAEAQSEPKVVQYIQLAIQADSTSLDAYMQQTNYYLNKENQEEAKKALKIVIDGLLGLDQETDQYDSSLKLNAAKLCVEVGEHSIQIPILEKIALENDSNYEAIYLLAFCHFQIENFYTALEYTENLLAKKDLEEDEEIFQATNELKEAIDKSDFSKAKDGDDYKNDQNEEGVEEEEDEEWMDVE